MDLACRNAGCLRVGDLRTFIAIQDLLILSVDYLRNQRFVRWNTALDIALNLNGAYRARLG